ncbi:MAG: hypothetical protein ABJF10_20130 [Chthoniobacter sp.]|uniref:hypothetical protein n=1 Tax=Chthoniobacter sp. TaxID=2510640 RepID=UPI0032AE6CCE
MKIRVAVFILLLGLGLAIAGYALKKRISAIYEHSTAESAARRTLIVGTWKEAASGDVFHFLPDGSFTALWNLDDTVTIDEPKGVLTQKYQCTLHGDWSVSGDQLHITIRALDGVDVHDVQLSAPEFKEKYGADKLEEVRKAIAETLGGSLKKAIAAKIVGMSDTYTTISLDDRQWIARDPDGTRHTRLRSD